MGLPRIGLGYDIHRLEAVQEGGGILLAGTAIPCDLRMIAHSDGDVLLHAISDALLGAVGASDLGRHFPDDDPQQAGRDSQDIVRVILAMPELAGWRVAQVDTNLTLQRPRLAPYRDIMQGALARLLDLPLDRTGLKARTKEGCDATGRGQAVEAQAIVMLEETQTRA